MNAADVAGWLAISFALAMAGWATACRTLAASRANERRAREIADIRARTIDSQYAQVRKLEVAIRRYADLMELATEELGGALAFAEDMAAQRNHALERAAKR